MKYKYDIQNQAKVKGQGVLVELPRVSGKDNPLRVKRVEFFEKRRELVAEGGKVFAYAKEHPELCPPMGTVLYMRNEYGVKAKLTVTFVSNGMPGTMAEILPIAEQPEHLRDEALLARHTAGIGRSGWTSWADEHAWRMWQDLQKGI